MGSGKPRIRARVLPLRSPLRLGALLALVAVMSCSDPAAAFRAALADLDGAIDSAPTRSSASLGGVFARAERKARSAENWVSLLKRARRSEAMGDRGRLALVAGHALARGPASEGLDACIADAFIRSGQPSRALDLFGRGLSRESRPTLWAEAVIASLEDGSLPPANRTASTFGRLAEITGDPRLFIDAAALSLAEGDRMAARAWLDRASGKKASVPAALLWDSGQYRELASLEKRLPSASEFKLMGDAAWILGDGEGAERRWRSAIAADPASSWRSYASLAALDGGTVSADQPGLFDDSGNFRELDDDSLGTAIRSSPRRAEAARLYREMLAVFPGDRGARIAYGAALARAGRKDEAAAFIEGKAATAPGHAGASVGANGAMAESLDSRALREWLGVGAALWPEGRLAAEVMRAIEARPDDAMLLDDGQALLISRGYYDDFLAVHAKAGKADRHYPRRALFDAYAAIAGGDMGRAAAILEEGAEGAGGAEGLFALAMLRDGTGDHAAAADLLQKALAVAGDPPVRCAVLKELGRIADSEGDEGKADGYYALAYLAYPSDTEAARLSHR